MPALITNHLRPARRSSELLPLENGDHLTRAEFERRYAKMTRLKKAELIEGVTYMTAAVRFDHAIAHGRILAWVAVYCAATPGLLFADNATVRLDAENEVQPDVLLRRASGGRSHISDDNYVEGVPELIIEVAGSSAAYDAHQKADVYRRNGVPEYLLWQIYEQQFDWWHLQDGIYTPLPPDEDGIIRSREFPGLWLDVDALLAGDLAQVFAVVQQGIATDAHSAFTHTLQ